MILKKQFLFYRIHVRHGFELGEMRPAIFVYTREFVKAACRKYGADGYMHQILLLFFCKLLFDIAQLLYAYEKKNAFHIRLFFEAAH